MGWRGLIYYSALLDPNNGWRRCIVNLYPRLLTAMDRYVKARQCPFCKRVFANSNALRNHLRRGRCSSSFEAVIRMVKSKIPEEEILRYIDPTLLWEIQ